MECYRVLKRKAILTVRQQGEALRTSFQVEGGHKRHILYDSTYDVSKVVKFRESEWWLPRVEGREGLKGSCC